MRIEASDHQFIELVRTQANQTYSFDLCVRQSDISQTPDYLPAQHILTECGTR
jgi:hypothetical protein